MRIADDNLERGPIGCTHLQSGGHQGRQTELCSTCARDPKRQLGRVETLSPKTRRRRRTTTAHWHSITCQLSPQVETDGRIPLLFFIFRVFAQPPLHLFVCVPLSFPLLLLTVQDQISTLLHNTDLNYTPPIFPESAGKKSLFNNGCFDQN